MLIRDLFSADITRDIPPVVYFHEQAPDKLAQEVREYIVTGGFPKDDPRAARVPDGIHDQFVRVLRQLSKELARKGGPELPAAWISGFYGSGKSSFAKLLGLALDGRTLPDGTSLASALLARDDSPLRQELVEAWETLRAAIDPLAVVFDVGAVARDGEHIYAAAFRQIQRRLGYCTTSSMVSETELKLETDGRWEDFLRAALQSLGRPWPEVRDAAMAEDHFSHALHVLDPDRYVEPMSWLDSHIGGQGQKGLSVDEAVRAVETMLRHRAPGKTLFLVVDEVSQYVHQDEDRMLKLQSFVSALGSRLKGRVWLLATGQQKLDDQAGQTLQKLKDRFPAPLRVHLAATNIRDVVHRRLLHKEPAGVASLRALFDEHRAKLKLHAYGCQEITADDFIEIYPLLPGYVELLMQITTNLRLHSSRVQGDTHAIRGLLQLLGELFRKERLAEREVGDLVTLDAIYEVQASSLEAETQATLAQVLNHEAVTSRGPLAARVVKAVVLLEQIQEQQRTSEDLVARCLYARVGDDGQSRAVQDILHALKDANCLAYTEKYGFKLQTSSGQEWMKERDDLAVPDEQIHTLVEDRLKTLMAQPDRPRWKARPFPWALFYSDRFRTAVRLGPGREEGAVTIDFRFITDKEGRKPEEWVRKSAEGELYYRLVWVAGELGDLKPVARDLKKSLRMLEIYLPRREGLPTEKRRLLIEEETRRDGLETRMERALAAAFMAGRLYFRGQEIDPVTHGNTFAEAVLKAAERYLPDLYQHFTDIVVSDKEWPVLLDKDISGATTKFYDGGLGILSLDGSKTVCTASGTVPSRILKVIEDNSGASGNTLISHFGRPPYGYPLDVVRACLAGLLRAGKIRIQPEGGATPLTSYADPGTKELFGTDRQLRMADYLLAKEGDVTQRDRNAIRLLFKKRAGLDIDPEPDALAEAGYRILTDKRAELRQVEAMLERLPGRPELPPELVGLTKAIDACLADRHVEKIVRGLKANLERLGDGFEKLGIWRTELTEEAVQAVGALAECRNTQVAQLALVDGLDAEASADAERIDVQVNTETPWRDRTEAEAAASRLRERYVQVRRTHLAAQARQAEAARVRVKARQDFDKLTIDESTQVLRPLAAAPFDTTEDAVSPSLPEMASRFQARLQEAEAQANSRLDEALDKKLRKPVRAVRLPVHGRELDSRDQLRTLFREMEDELGPLLDRGVRVRIE